MKVLTILVALIGFSSPAFSVETQEEFISGFLAGHFYLIGKEVDSNEAYFGDVEIKKVEKGLSVIRKIKGVTSYGVAFLQKATSNKVTILSIKFKTSGVEYEENCMVSSDFDNYPRITCYVQKNGIDTMSPGLEAFFIKQN